MVSEGRRKFFLVIPMFLTNLLGHSTFTSKTGIACRHHSPNQSLAGSFFANLVFHG